jgi:hypothetical protein
VASAPRANPRGRHRTARRPSRRTAYACLLILVLSGLIAAGALLLFTRLDPQPPVAADRVEAQPTSVPSPTGRAPRPAAARAPEVAVRHDRVRVPDDGFVSWALLDRDTGMISGSRNLAAPGDTMSMVKVWLVADYLRQAHARGDTPDPRRLAELSLVVRGDEAGTAAEALYRGLGAAASINRLVTVCGLTESRPYKDYWSRTTMSARDTVRMGLCLADGRAAGPRWTPWLLTEMRGAQGVGDFGAREALPATEAAEVAIKNGWLLRDEDGLWHVSCLAVGQDWVLGVLARYPGDLGLGHGKRLCRSIGAQLIGG